jgi:hypothetical protein
VIFEVANLFPPKNIISIKSILLSKFFKMTIEFITKEDLYFFKKELLEELLSALQHKPQQPDQWLKSADVREMLNVSPNTLQRYRINGALKFSKVGSTFFYKADDVQKMLEGNKTK